MGYQSDSVMIIQPISYSSDSYDSAVINNTNSVIKNTIDTWYKNNLRSYASYIADETFCSDRSLNFGSGYLTSVSTTYETYGRLVDKKIPSLKCIQDNDKFKISNESARLDYPVALITTDETALAGGVFNIPNSVYYLYNGQYLWTLSPASFTSSDTFANAWAIDPTGNLYPWGTVDHNFGIRPVINLRSDVQITKGDGTSLNPYVVSTT